MHVLKMEGEANGTTGTPKISPSVKSDRNGDERLTANCSFVAVLKPCQMIEAEKHRKRWKVKYYTGLTKYSVVSRAFSSFPGWVECENEEDDWNVIWLDNALVPEKFVKMKHYQKVNHFIGTSAITRKKSFTNEKTLSPSVPILPIYLDFANSCKKERTFIIKPDGGSQGKGIFLSRNFEDINPDENLVAQRYIHKPLLLDGYKFDLRMYILITGCSPLRVFLHRDGLIRLATEAYSFPSAENMSCSTMHLTNYSVNKASSSFHRSIDPQDGNSGHKRSLRHVFEKLALLGYNTAKIMEEIDDLIIKTLVTIQPSLAHAYSSCQPDDLSNSMCFEILGFDIMLDYKLKPWLLEVNHSPSFSVDSEVDEAVKFPVIYDALKLLNIVPEDKYRYKAKLKTQISSRLAKKAFGERNREERLKERQRRASELEKHRSHWETLNCGGYRKIYPTNRVEMYESYLKTAAQIWETLTGANKKKMEFAKQKMDEKARQNELQRKAVKFQGRSSTQFRCLLNHGSTKTGRTLARYKSEVEATEDSEELLQDRRLDFIELSNESETTPEKLASRTFQGYVYNSARLTGNQNANLSDSAPQHFLHGTNPIRKDNLNAYNSLIYHLKDVSFLETSLQALKNQDSYFKPRKNNCNKSLCSGKISRRYSEYQLQAAPNLQPKLLKQIEELSRTVTIQKVKFSHRKVSKCYTSHGLKEV